MEGKNSGPGLYITIVELDSWRERTRGRRKWRREEMPRAKQVHLTFVLPVIK